MIDSKGVPFFLQPPLSKGNFIGFWAIKCLCSGISETDVLPLFFYCHLHFFWYNATLKFVVSGGYGH